MRVWKYGQVVSCGEWSRKYFCPLAPVNGLRSCRGKMLMATSDPLMAVSFSSDATYAAGPPEDQESVKMRSASILCFAFTSPMTFVTNDSVVNVCFASFAFAVGQTICLTLPDGTATSCATR